MDKEQTVRNKSYQFALRIVKLCLWLKQENHYDISSQLLKASTSIGANIEEATASYSRKEFFHKMAIASKEARETHYWLRLLTDSGIVTQKQSSSLLDSSEELVKMLTSIVKTGKEKTIKNEKLKTQN